MTTKYAAHCDYLVLGIGESEAAALEDATKHGAENESALDTVAITPEAASYVQGGGDCRALKWVFDPITDMPSVSL